MQANADDDAEVLAFILNYFCKRSKFQHVFIDSVGAHLFCLIPALSQDQVSQRQGRYRGFKKQFSDSSIKKKKKKKTLL